MSINAVSLAAGGSTVDGSSFATPSVAPAGLSLLALWVVHSTTGGTTVSGITGLGLSWLLQKRVTISGSTKIEAWTAVCPASPGSGTFAIATAAAVGSIVWDLDQVTGQDPATPLIVTNQPTATGSGATEPALAYGAPAAPANRFLFGCGVAANITQQFRPNWAELADVSQVTPSVSLETQWRSDTAEQVGSSTRSGQAAWGAIGLEIAAAPPPGVLVDADASLAEQRWAAQLSERAPAVAVLGAQRWSAQSEGQS
jgi:hypothetical protein